MTTPAQQIRDLVAEDTILMPGVYDAITARIAARLGFDIVFISGYSVSAARSASPTSASSRNPRWPTPHARHARLERARDRRRRHRLRQRGQHDAHRRATSRTRAPPASSSRTRSGRRSAATLQGKQVIPTAEHAAKIRAAADARGERDLFIVARTDARQPLGLDEAIERCLAYKEAGADALFVEAPQSIEELEQIAKRASAAARREHDRARRHAAPLSSELKDLGFQLIVCPLAALYAATQGVNDVLTELKDKETTAALYDELTTFDEFGELVELEKRYADESKYAT